MHGAPGGRSPAHTAATGVSINVSAHCASLSPLLLHVPGTPASQARAALCRTAGTSKAEAAEIPAEDPQGPPPTSDAEFVPDPESFHRNRNIRGTIRLKC